jgi:parallel beta-helix repeat protein
MKINKLKTLLAASIACAAVSASANTLVVGNDPTQCKDAQYTTINAAVLAAQPGDTVRVCPGTYPEYVVVNKPLELVGARKGNAAAKGRQQSTDKESIVVNGGQGGFDVIANDVRIAGFTVLGNTASNSYPNAGINVRTGSNRIIESNVLRNNGLGIYVETGLQQGLDVERNAFLDNARVPNPNFIPSGGLFDVSTQTNNSEISNNYFSGGDPNQFSLNIDGSDGGLVISHNQAIDGGAFLVIGSTTGAKVEHNSVLRAGGSGVFSFGSNNALLIAHNSFDQGAGNGIRFLTGIFGPNLPNADAVISDNSVTNGAGNGIRLDATVRATVENNQLDNNKLNGIRLEQADANHIVNNRARANGINGIRAETQSSNNNIEKNDMRDNVSFDADDETAGSGTAGTANFWVKNHGGTQNRPGLLDH